MSSQEVFTVMMIQQIFGLNIMEMPVHLLLSVVITLKSLQTIINASHISVSSLNYKIGQLNSKKFQNILFYFGITFFVKVWAQYILIVQVIVTLLSINFVHRKIIFQISAILYILKAASIVQYSKDLL